MDVKAQPYLACRPETAYDLGRGLLLASALPSELSREVEGLPRVALERTLFALRIPTLPDLLASTRLVGGSEGERLAEALTAQGRLIGQLSRSAETAFALRFLSHPERGEVEIILIGRCLSAAGQSERLAVQLARDLSTLLNGFEYPTGPVTSPDELQTALDPFRGAGLLELRQHEELLSLGGPGTALVVYPFEPPTQSWVGLFETLLRQPAACLVSLFLQPTELYPLERASFTQAVNRAATLADQTYQTALGAERVVRPPARLVARLYADYLRRLTAPFLVTAQVTSPDSATARTVAQALAAELRARAGLAGSPSEEERLPTGCDVLSPHDDELRAARRTLTHLDLQRWGQSRHRDRNDKDRLAYLADARTASAVFRFPVALRGGLPGVRVRQPLAAYETGSRPAAVGPDEVHLGSFAERGGAAGLPLAAFGRHLLVAGTTGSGKTTSCFQLLGQLWERGIPFLVIEPAKHEYRALLDSPLGPALRVFTLGDESVAPFRLNPLEILPGVRVESHLAQLRACFEAALPTFGPLPSLIEESLHQVYQDHGWELTDRGRAWAAPGEPVEPRLMPTLGELYAAIIQASERRGYSTKTLQDVRAAAAGRIGSLLRGSKGRLLNTRRSLPLAELLATPAVLELESLNDDERALVMLFLLTGLREHCRANRTGSTLQHVTLIEEAHRVMAATSHIGNREVSADTRAEATAMFSAALSELRAYGEGLIIAEQIPSRLAEDALKNTNTKLVHRLPGEDDCRAIGATMRLLPHQEEQLPGLSSGVAALYTDGYERPTFVQVDNPRADWGLPERVLDERVEQHQASFETAQGAALLPFEGCRQCERQCRYRDRVTPLAYEPGAAQRFRRAVGAFDAAITRGEARAGWLALVRSCQDALSSRGLGGDEHAAYCLFSHLWETRLRPDVGAQFRRAAREARDGHD